MANRVVLYEDAKAEWRWRVVNEENGEIVGAASEGFANKQIAEDNLDLVYEALRAHQWARSPTGRAPGDPP
jgi:uncharacterized protein YegP (UPF0339 family)